jgi:hypothetical protein
LSFEANGEKVVVKLVSHLLQGLSNSALKPSLLIVHPVLETAGEIDTINWYFTTRFGTTIYHILNFLTTGR